MAEYIEREAEIDALSAEALANCLDSVSTGIKSRYHRAAQRVIDGVPAADVIPVVHCRDCRFWAKNFPEDGYGWCQNYVAGLMDRNENSFCAVGVGKENT